MKKLYDFRASKLAFKATIGFYLDNGIHAHRAHREFPDLEKAKRWVTKKLDPKLNVQWCICDDIGVELEGC